MIVKMNGTAIAAAKSCELTVSAEKLPVASETDGKWEHCIAGRKKWSVSCKTLLTGIKTHVQMVGQIVTLIITTADNDTLTGQALVEQWSGSGAVGSLGGHQTFPTLRKDGAHGALEVVGIGTGLGEGAVGIQAPDSAAGSTACHRFGCKYRYRQQLNAQDQGQ